MYDSREDTIKHIEQVKIFLKKLIADLEKRGINHDKSKLEPPEKEHFDLYTPKLKEVTYQSEEYKTFLKELKPALDHHYANNRHHSQYFEDGIKGMTLVDLCEMLSDWKASTMRLKDGDILGSIEKNQKIVGYSDELKQILINTVNYYFEDCDTEAKLLSEKGDSNLNERLC